MRLVQNATLQILLGKQIQQRLFQFQIRSNGEIKFAKVPVKNDQLRPCIALQKICPFTCCEEYVVFLQKKLPEKKNYQKAEVGSLTRQHKALKIRYQIVHRANLRYQKVWRTPQN